MSDTDLFGAPSPPPEKKARKTWPTYQERKEDRQRAEEAAAAVLARGPVEPPAEELARVTQLLAAAAFQFARTMPKNPHWYTLRKKWESDEDFVLVVQFIRLYGSVERFPNPDRGWPYIYMDIDGFHYWTMGSPIEQTILINRKPVDENGCELPPPPPDLFSQAPE
jgi:hypothetical protein